MTNTTRKQNFQVEIRYGLPDNNKSTPLHTFSGSASGAATAVAEACIEHTTRKYSQEMEPWLTVSFEPTPTKSRRATITASVLSSLQENEWDEIEEGWEDERVSISKDLQPGFALCQEQCTEDSIAGFWYDEATFLFTTFDLSEGFHGNTEVHVSHWHPGSHCSGSWNDQYTIVAPRLASTHKLNDDDGYYIGFESVDTSTPETVSSALESAVMSWYLYGAERRLIDAYLLGFKTGPVDLFPHTENGGYEIDGFGIDVTTEVFTELKDRHSQRIKHEAREWLETLEGLGDYASDGDALTMTQRLRAIVKSTQGTGPQ